MKNDKKWFVCVEKEDGTIEEHEVVPFDFNNNDIIEKTKTHIINDYKNDIQITQTIYKDK